MESFTEFVDLGAGRAWFFIPSAVLLGSLHGLEPGHSKTLMAAFIVAIRGTVKQAVLLGLAATVSHTLIVWVVALGGLYLWRGSDAAESEPYLQLASGIIVLLLAAWMLWRTYQAQRHPEHAHRHHGGRSHEHKDGLAHTHDHRQPHGHGHGHGRAHEQRNGSVLAATLERGTGDAHAQAHAAGLARQVTKGDITTWQIVLFGLTGGLIPCPAAITVLLLCLQLQEPILGVALVLCFSIGLAVTLMGVGALAAVGVQKASARWTRATEFFRRAPYFSGLLLVLVGCYMAAVGIAGLGAR